MQKLGIKNRTFTRTMHLVIGFVALMAVSAPQQPATQADTSKLETITVRESAKPAHRYAAPWSPTATKIPTPLRDTPQSISVITSSLIREQSMQSMTDALRYAPGITMGQGEGHRDAPTIRGNASTADFFVDGVRDDAQYFRDLYNVERIEAIAGSNAMLFGRGGGGGVINRVTKQAGWSPTRELTLEGGSFGKGRGALDYGGAVSPRVAARLNGMYEHSLTFRDNVTLTRAGVSPSAALQLGDRTALRVSGEYFEDHRTVDRGVPSFQGRPSPAPFDAFFGVPDSSYASVQVGSAGATLEHRASERLALRTQARVTAYDKFYQNVFPGAMTETGAEVSLSAYNNDTQRENYFAQSEATLRFPSTRVAQTLLLGAEVGRQATDNLRLTGFFDDATTSIRVPFDAPTVSRSVTFRAAGADANNSVVANVASVYAQNQLSISPRLQATLGARVERFDLAFRDHRDGQRLQRIDDVFSPRVGLVLRAATPLSLYTSYSVSHLPSSGDQFSGLTPTTQTLEPERFANSEVGVKWDMRPELSANLAAYQLTRTNSAAPSALDPGIIVQTGKQRTQGVELSFAGRLARDWDVVGAFTTQGAKIVSRTSAAPAGAKVPLVPRNALSLWNRYQVSRALGVGVGAIAQSAMYAAIDNAVTLPGFWRLDAAAFFGAFQNVKLQANVENLLNRRYYATSHGNNNILPGAPRTIRVSLTTQIQ
jgi:catecholate siderophore receptor